MIMTWHLPARWPRYFQTWIKPFAAATIIISLAALTAPVLQRLPHANLSLLFMTGVLIVAVRFGLWPSIYASILSFLLYNFFFTSPYLTLKVSEEGDVATLVFFLIMASLAGNLAGRMRDAMAKREKAISRSGVLQDLTRRLAGAATREQVLRVLIEQLSTHFSQAVTVFLSGDQSVAPAVLSTSPGEPLSQLKNARRQHGHTSIPGWTTLPVDTVRGVAGTIAIKHADPSSEEKRFARVLIDQAAVALERTSLVGDLAEARLVSEREQLRAALLSSVSHDLRTPLSSIIGAASSLAAYKGSLRETDTTALLQSIVEEAERLDRHIQNLLDMTRLGQGELHLNRDWEDLRDLLSAAARRLRLAEHGIRVDADIADEAQIVEVHGDLIEQVFVNLLDNAARHSATPATIRVTARKSDEGIVIEVLDDGPGIPEREREKVFEPFYRIRDGVRESGAGLGLSICRGIIRTHGGDITAHASPDGRGSLLRIRLPASSANPPVISDESE